MVRHFAEGIHLSSRPALLEFSGDFGLFLGDMTVSLRLISGPRSTIAPAREAREARGAHEPRAARAVRPLSWTDGLERADA